MTFVVDRKVTNHVIIQSMIDQVNTINSIKDQVVKLSIVTSIVENILLYGQKNNLQPFVDELVQEEILQDEGSKLALHPLTTEELAQYLTSNIGYTHHFSSKPAQETDETQAYLELITEVMNHKTFLVEIIPEFLKMLFPKYDEKISHDLALDLYLIISEEYKQMLEEKDIESLSKLGQKTIMLIINNIYKRIDEHKDLRELSKDILIRYIRKFFLIVDGTVEYFKPK